MDRGAGGRVCRRSADHINVSDAASVTSITVASVVVAHASACNVTGVPDTVAIYVAVAAAHQLIVVAP